MAIISGGTLRVSWACASKAVRQGLLPMQPQQSPRSRLLLVLRDRNFRIIWYVSSLNLFSRRYELLVLSWFVLQETNSPLQLALVWVFANLATPVVGPFSGLIADRFSRHRILILAQSLNTLNATAILFLVVTDLIQPWHVFIVFFLSGVSQFLELPSRHTAILDIVGDKQLINALSLEVMGLTIGRIAGPLLGGVLLNWLGYGGSYVFVLMVHLVALGLLTRVKIPTSRGITKGEPVWTALKEGMRYALHNRALLGVLYISMVINGLGFPVQQFIPAIGRDFLGVGPAMVGLLASAWGFGMLVSAGVIASTLNIRYHGRIFVAGSLLSLLMVPLFVWSPWYALSFALLILGGVGNSGFGTMQSPITMLSAPPEMRGRMMGLLILFIGIGAPLGTLEIGLLAVAIGTQIAISVNALAGLLLLLPALLLTPLVWQPSSEPLPQRL